VGPSAASGWPLYAALCVVVRFCAALGVGRPAASCWSLSVPLSFPFILCHLSVVRRLCCGALAQLVHNSRMNKRISPASRRRVLDSVRLRLPESRMRLALCAVRVNPI